MKNEAARDLWAQIFERAIAAPNAAVWEEDTSLAEARQADVEKAYEEAGFTEEQILFQKDAFKGLPDPEYQNSPGVMPGLEYKLGFLSDKARTAAASFSKKPLDRFEVAIDPTAGVSASLTNVIMTDQGIVAVSSFLFRWCGLIGKAFARTFYSDLPYWTWSKVDANKDVAKLTAQPELAAYWIRIFYSFATTGTHIMVPFKPSVREEFIVYEQMAWAMEYFTVAHEIGHHVLEHRALDGDPKQQEFDADRFAAQVCENLAYEPFLEVPNPYIQTSAGGTVMLLSLEILRSLQERLGRENATGDVHPPAVERISALTSRNVLRPGQLKMDQEFHKLAQRILNAAGILVAHFHPLAGEDLANALAPAEG